MKNYAAINGIKHILIETNDRQGWDIPEYIVTYEAEVLASKIDRNPWQPEPSYAERYMTVRTIRDALDLADTCWFTRAVFPELKSRHGIRADYYVDIGTSCYGRVLEQSTIPAIRAMHDHFEFLAETVYTAVRNYGDFREMWD